MYGKIDRHSNPVALFAQEKNDIQHLAARPRLLTLISVSLSLAIIFLALRELNLNRLLAVLLAADWRWVAIAILMNCGALLMRGLRWYFLLGRKISPWRACHTMNVTVLLNQIPLRAGDVARSFLAQQDGVRLLTAATLISLERLLDLLFIIAALLWALGRLPNPDDTLSTTATLIGAAVLLLFVLIWLITSRPGFALVARQRHRWFFRRSFWRQVIVPILMGLRSIQDFRLVLVTAGWTVIAWCFSFATFAAIAPALSLDSVDVILLATLAGTLTSLGIAAPLTVASIGPYEALVLLAGSLIGLNEEAALALALLSHGISLGLYTLFGIIGTAILGVSFRDLLQSRTEITRDSPATDLQNPPIE